MSIALILLLLVMLLVSLVFRNIEKEFPHRGDDGLKPDDYDDTSTVDDYEVDSAHTVGEVGSPSKIRKTYPLSNSYEVPQWMRRRRARAKW